MDNTFNFLGLPPEIRRMIYKQLLVSDFRSGDRQWSLSNLHDFNKRHPVTRVSSLVRRESQELFYQTLTWTARVGSGIQDCWKLQEQTQIHRILRRLTPTQASNIHGLKLIFVVENFQPMDSSDFNLVATFGSPQDYVRFMSGRLPSIQRLSITWHNHCSEWNPNMAALLESAAALRHIKSIQVEDAWFFDSPKHGERLAEMTRSVLAGETPVLSHY